MKIGVPKETKSHEYRVALRPAGVEELAREGHQILVQRGAGKSSGFLDSDYEAAGAQMGGPEDAWSCDLVVKVKEPLASEFSYLKEGQTVFAYFHFAADERLTRAVQESGAIAIAYETVQDAYGTLPLLTPMSEVAGRMAVQEGAKYLEKYFGGRGMLLGGIPGTPRAEVLIIGGGIVGFNAAKIAAGNGANVTILDVNLDRLRYLDDVLPRNTSVLFCDPQTIREGIRRADIIVGAVLSPGKRAPHLIVSEDLESIKEGAVIVDVAIDQGGCVETSRPTSHEDPIYSVNGVIHYCVTNMPGGVPRTSTFGLTNATLPFVKELAHLGWRQVVERDCALRRGLNIAQGKILHPGVAEAFNLEYSGDRWFC